VTEPTYDEGVVEAELRARAAYAAPHRHYHDQRHLDECLRELDGVPALTENERRLLRWAILWHDAVYEPGLHDNEERSADLAKRELVGCGMDADVASEVARLIRLTSGHRCDPDDRLGALLISIDLAILGSDPHRYREYAAQARQEYAHVPDPMWRTGRAEVLKRLLQADPLYPHAEFHGRLARQARRNMEDELKALGAG
jgi:predicted metal-dependent HD superfamily phosphohydrolase